MMNLINRLFGKPKRYHIHVHTHGLAGYGFRLHPCSKHPGIYSKASGTQVVEHMNAGYSGSGMMRVRYELIEIKDTSSLDEARC